MQLTAAVVRNVLVVLIVSVYVHCCDALFFSSLESKGSSLLREPFATEPFATETVEHKKEYFSSDNDEELISARAWRTDQGLSYPETEMLERMGKSDSGIGLSGGGLRAYFSTLGYLRGLLDLGLLNRTRYMSCVSGGCWATAPYIYHSSKYASTPEHFLGPIVQPQDFNWFNLREIKNGCGRKVPTSLDVILLAAFDLFYKEYNPLGVWYRTITEVFLKPVGIDRLSLFSWNRSTVADIIARNPSLIDRDFVLPCDGENRCDHRPYPIINSAILGPEISAPFGLFHMSFTSLETTPLYIGSPPVHTVTYAPGPLVSETNRTDTKENRRSTMMLGGIVEPIAFGGRTYGSNKKLANGTFPKPYLGLRENHSHGILSVPRPNEFFTLANATGTSSWAPGSILAAESVVNNILNAYIGLSSSYWSPQPRKTNGIFSTDILLADGGSIDNQGLLALVRRKVKKAVVFITTNIPLKPRSEYNPFMKLPSDSDIDSSFSSFFGFFDLIPDPGFDFAHNHIFSRFAFPWIVDRMQKAQAAGKGIVVKSKLRTLRNKWWDIPGGHEIEIAWVYLGRVREWEKQLPKNLYYKLVPKGKEEQMNALVSSGPYKNFPHIPTSELSYSPEKGNLLASLAGWVIQQNKDVFIEMLS